jgi:cellulose synthase/poly-beta-1,6-N-acetylglucosamine synthase-like glycosyltransferase
MALLFWLSVAIIGYVYVGYPLMLRLWARIRPRPLQAAAARRDAAPAVSIVLAARNEGARLAARLANLLALEYPAGRRQIIVVSDGSTDNTAEVVGRFGSAVELVELRPGGKALALNAGVARARHDIIVFADARQVFAPDALLELTAPLSDPQVGGVTGELMLDCESALFGDRRADIDRRHREGSDLRDAAADSGDRRTRAERRTILSTIGDGVGMYWRYEKELRRLESAVGSTIGATGAIYAIRRSLWCPLPAETILDDVLAPMRVVLAGRRVVFNDKARAFDRAAADADAETQRKVRTLAGNYQILWLEPRLLLPWRNPVWLQYCSHKLGRLAAPHAMLALFAANIALFGEHLFYQLSLLAQVSFVLLAGYGAVLEWAQREERAPDRERGRSVSNNRFARAAAPATPSAREMA